MYQIFRMEYLHGKPKSVLVAETVDEELAKKRVARFGGYCVEKGTKKLLCQSMASKGPKFVTIKKDISSGEDACLL